MRRWTAGAENTRVHRHFEQVLALLGAAGPGAVGLGQPGLGAAQRVHRAALLEELGRYRARRRFPKNHRLTAPAPSFVDELDGTRCAVAHLLEATGETALVARVAAESNHARVRDLAGDGAFRAWLWRNGLSVREAAIIQPSYCQVAAACICMLESPDTVLEATVLDEASVRVEAVLVGGSELAAGDVLPSAGPIFGIPEPAAGHRWIASLDPADGGSVRLVFPMLDASTVDTAVCSALGADAPLTLARETLVDILSAAGPRPPCDVSLALEDPLWSNQEGSHCPEPEPEPEAAGCVALPTRATPWWGAAMVAAAMALAIRSGGGRQQRR